MTAATAFNAIDTRLLLERLPQPINKENLAIERDETIYIPASHLKALDWQVSLVQGARGSGKSFWTAALFADAGRRYLQQNPSVSSNFRNLNVNIGFGLGNDPSRFPGEDLLRRLRDASIPARSIWKAVILRHALDSAGLSAPFSEKIDAAVTWVHTNGDASTELLAKADSALAGNDQRLLILFDSLERLADNWESVREHVTAILRVALDCRSYKAIRCKVFLRPDMYDDTRIWQFSESSKLTQTRITLDWRPSELYTLLLVCMGNHTEYGREFREALTKLTAAHWLEQAGRYLLPDRFSRDESQVRKAIEALCGPYMGQNAKRGHVYTWIPTHLADAFGRATPRSLITAFTKAAEWTDSHQSSHPLPVHFDGIHEGVRAASATRNSEIKEDYPWVEALLGALRGKSVLLEENVFAEAWRPLMSKLQSGKRLPPRRFDSSEPGQKNKVRALLQDLADLGIVYEAADGRYNIVDIYRVYMGIGRKGGVKPPAR